MSQGGLDGGRLVAGRYRLASAVGRGGMGTVWQAGDEVLHRDVAVKEVIFPSGVAEHERDVLYERTLREARATARLNHPNIVTVHDVVEEAGHPWIVMEFVRARSLQDLIDEEGPQQPRLVADLGRQMLAALRAAHGIGILHRDVKPSNVLIAADDRAVLTDFGIAYIEGDTTLTQTGLIVGSPAYIAPERARGERATPASDLWALGATLYCACEGHPPHQRTDAVSMLAAILTEDPPPPRHAGPLRPVLDGLLQRDPAVRMPAEAAAGLLAEIARGAAVPGAQPTGPMPYAASSYPPPTPPTDVPLPNPRDATQHLPYSQEAPQPGRIGPDGQTAPSPPRGGRHVPTSLIVTVSVLATAVVAVAGFLVQRSMHDTTPPRTSRSTAAAQHGANAPAANSPGPSSIATSEPTAKPELPAGWRWASGPGYTVGVPAGWQRSVKGKSVFWRDPASAAYLQVDRTEWTGEPYTAWEQWETEVLAKGTLQNYQRIDLRSVTGTAYSAADIEFTWVGQSDQLMHGVDRHAIATGGRRYAVFIAIPAGQWDSSHDRVNTFLDTFRP